MFPVYIFIRTKGLSIFLVGPIINFNFFKIQFNSSFNEDLSIKEILEIISRHMILFFIIKY